MNKVSDGSEGADPGPPSLEELAARSRDGDRSALEDLVARIQDRVYNLAIRMLWHPEDARDATQEILIRVVTHLGTFRAESAFLTWVYRVAANYLLTARAGRLEAQRLTFERFGQDLDEGLSDAHPSPDPPIDDALLIEEVKIGCTLGMLSCLDRHHRLAYILGEILEIDGTEAANMLQIDAATFRKRLSRARSDIVAFTKAKCGLISPDRRCRCRRRVRRALELGRVDPQHLLFASDPVKAKRFPTILAEIRRLEEARRAVALYRSHPDFRVPEALGQGILRLVDDAPA